jgi:putative ABC transport system permease protein
LGEAPITFVTRQPPALGRIRCRGRDFTDRDDEAALLAAVVSEALARRFWPREDPLGKRLSLRYPDSPPVEVIGVAGDGKYAGLNEDPQPFVYLPIRQIYSGTTTVLASGGSDPALLLPSIRAEIRNVDPAIAVFAARPLSDRLSLPLFPARVAATLLGAFAVLSLSLAAIGIYGVMSQIVSRRRREIGIRVALGARRQDVLRLAMTAGMAPALLGVLAGAGASVVLARWMTSVLFGVSPRDPWTFGATSGLLLFVAALSCFLPARRAAGAAPMVSLRTE